jgi:integrase
MKLTSKAVGALTMPPGKTDHFEWDDDLPGFGYRLRAAAGGKVRRSWIVQYRRAGATRRLLLGSGHVLNAEQARIAAKKALAKVALGEDPQGDRQERRSKNRVTLQSSVADYLALKAPRLRPTTLDNINRYLTGPHFKSLHGMPIDQVSRKDVAARLVSITREHGSVTAARARAALSAFYGWAMGEGLADSNPVVGTNKPADSPARERTLSNDELAAIWRACGDDDYGRIIKLLILTGCRKREIGEGRWSEIADGIWTIPGARTKNKREHKLPLMPAVLEIIKGVPRIVGRDPLFGARGNGFGGWSKSKAKLDERCGVKGWIVHDLRRTLATRLGDLGVQPHIIEQILNHQSGHKRGPAGTYNRSPYAREVAAALALWSDHLRTLVEGGERKVVPLRS